MSIKEFLNLNPDSNTFEVRVIFRVEVFLKKTVCDWRCTLLVVDYGCLIFLQVQIVKKVANNTQTAVPKERKKKEYIKVSSASYSSYYTKYNIYINYLLNEREVRTGKLLHALFCTDRARFVQKSKCNNFPLRSDQVS